MRSLNVDIGWLAGILDGEGSIQLNANVGRGRHGQRQLKIMIVNTSFQLIDKVSCVYDMLGVSYYYIKENRGEEKNWKPVIRIVVAGLDSIQTILEATLDHLTSKRQEAQVVLDYVNWRSSLPKHSPDKELGAKIRLMQETVAAQLSNLKERKMQLHLVEAVPSRPLKLRASETEGK